MIPSEFVEKILNIELMPYQKDFINKAYEAAKDHKQLIYYPGRARSRSNSAYLQALAFIMAGQDEGIVKKEIIRND